MKRKRGLLMALVLFAVLSCQGEKEGTSSSGLSDAEVAAWPGRVLTVYVPVAVGGNMDVKVRLYSKYLTKYLPGTNVVVENRPGANGITCLTEYLAEQPNTSALLYASAGQVVVNPFYTETMYTREDYIPLHATDEVLNGVFANPARTGIASMEDLKAYGQGKTIKAGCDSNGLTFLVTKALLTMAGLKSDMVDADSAPEHLVNCLAGNVDVAYAAMNLAQDYVEQGRLVALGAFTSVPYTDYPGITVPSFAEQGYDIVSAALTFFAIRAGTDRKIVDKMSDALMKVWNDPEFISEFAKARFVPCADPSGEAVDAILRKMDGQLSELDALINVQ
jgi:tripartite-type tricarboxylate transporter receptor subunit TctC